MASATAVATPNISFKLSSNDSAVLQALFDKGEVSFSDSSANAASSEHVSPNSQNFKIDESLPSFPRCQMEEKALEVLKTRQLDIIRRIQQHESTSNDTSDAQLESASISATETQVLTNAIEELSSLIAQYPDYPPLYANRAQALRLLIQSKSRERNKTDQDAAIFYPENKELATKLLSDLSKAISLASPVPVNNGQESRAVSPAQFSLLSTTYMHRGYLLLKAGKIRKEAEKTNTTPDDTKGGPEQLLAINSRDQLEEMASQDFFEAGRYGNEIAKQLSVQTNPYAKMCGAIVKEALKKEISEFHS